jgi:peptidoglycan/LPS O-acetylase OafA/YrhL
LTRPSTAAPGGFRPDVEGLRAVALAVVLLTHAGVSFVQGGYAGVDVFFVISGYLITRMILGEIGRTGRVSLVRFYARRAKRLLPLAFTVLVVAAVLSAIVLSPLRAESAGRDIAAAALYVVNWRFAAESVDYFASIGGLHAGPVQHFWTLSIEEQFYLAWPVLLLAATWWHRHAGRDPRPAAAVAVGVVGLASFGYALLRAGAPDAYFSTLTRSWELTVGCALALLPARASVPRPAAGALAWAGLVAIVGAAVVFDHDTAVPGWATLVPTAGAAALIFAGTVDLRTAPARLLQLAPVRYMGRISYSWYLWHWPPLVFAEALTGSLSTPARLAIVAASAAPAIVTHHLIERPLHHSR